MHGAALLGDVQVDSYNVELGDADGFVGDKANKLAFRDILERLRKTLRKSGGEDPLGEKHSHVIGKKKLDEHLSKGDARAAAIVQSAIEDFARQLTAVIRRFMRLKAWRDTQIIMVGGGGHEPMVIMHNDAVAQGLSELPHLAGVSRWGILTIGTGLGNARFSRRPRRSKD